MISQSFCRTALEAIWKRDRILSLVLLFEPPSRYGAHTWAAKLQTYYRQTVPHIHPSNVSFSRRRRRRRCCQQTAAT